MSLRVVQWTSGGVAKEAVRAVLSHHDLELVGMYAYSEEKVGRDAGELVGLPALGITATNDVDAILAARPDVVSYNPLYADIDHLVRLLEAGVDVVSTCQFLTGWSYDFQPEKYGPDARARIEEAAQRGDASIFGTGINPGHVNYQACVMSSLCDDLTHVRVSEVVHDIVPFLGDPNIAAIGFGEPIDSPGLPARQKSETSVFGDAIELMARVLEIELDEIRCSSDFAPATEDFDTPGGPIAEGTIAGVQIRWEGVSQGVPVLENRQVWACGRRAAGIEDWGDPNQHGYMVQITADPLVHNVMLPIPRGDLRAMSVTDQHALGMRITALPAINAIPAVHAASPGIRTYQDLPTIGAGGRLHAPRA